MTDLADTAAPGRDAADEPTSVNIEAEPRRPEGGEEHLRLRSVLRVFGVVLAVVLVAAAGLLQWGASFADTYVSDELAAQQISFPDAENLANQGREDLVPFAGERVDTGEEAEAYASFIEGHLAQIGGGSTYAELGGPERAAEAAVDEAVAAGAPEEEIAALRAEAEELTATRDTMFQGQMLRTALLTSYAWSTVGQIAQLSAAAAVAVAVALAALVILDAIRDRRRKPRMVLG